MSSIVLYLFAIRGLRAIMRAMRAIVRAIILGQIALIKASIYAAFG
jgi:hypothetical protein